MAPRSFLWPLGAILALAWAQVLYLAWGMERMDIGAGMLLMPRMSDWQAVDLWLVFLMWAVMMVAMMLPSALPMLLAFDAERTRVASARHGARLATFVAGYVVMWTGFSVVATLLQWGLLEARLLSPAMKSMSPRLGGALLVAAGAFQFTPLKHACLAVCRSPWAFLMREWRPGVGGSFVMGLRHGLFCTGCCAMLMALLFLLGVMNVLWIAALTAFVLLEKTAPGAKWVSRAAGAAMTAWGAWLLAA